MVLAVMLVTYLAVSASPFYLHYAGLTVRSQKKAAGMIVEPIFRPIGHYFFFKKGARLE